MKQRVSMIAAAALLLLVLNTSGAAAARRLLQPGGIGTLGGYPSAVQTFTWTSAPGKLTTLMSSCQWNGFYCKSSYAPAFSSELPLVEETNYPARAKASIAATNLFCSQFSQDQCAWPCQFDVLNGCQISGHLYYQPWTCPRSLGYAWNHCSQQPQWSSKPACLSSSMCSWNENATTGPAKCTSTYASNMTDQQRIFVYGSLYFTTMPRELHGCCKGSTYSFQLMNFCAAAFSGNGTGSTSPASCAKVPGCVWDVYNSDGCVPSPQTQVALQFAYKPSDTLAAPLKKLAGECAAITDASKCSSYKPVAVDPSKVQTYLDKALLSSLNQPLEDSACPLPSRPPPWV